MAADVLTANADYSGLNVADLKRSFWEDICKIDRNSRLVAVTSDWGKECW